MRSGFPVAGPPPPVLGAGAESHGHHREPHGTHLTLTWAFALVPPASAVSADQQEAGLGVGEGPGVHLKTSSPPVPVCPPGWAILSLRSRGRPRQSFVGPSPHESWDGPLRCRAGRPCTCSTVSVSKVTAPWTEGRSGGPCVCVPRRPGLRWACLQEGAWEVTMEGKIQGPAVRRRSCGERV